MAPSAAHAARGDGSGLVGDRLIAGSLVGRFLELGFHRDLVGHERFLGGELGLDLLDGRLFGDGVLEGDLLHEGLFGDGLVELGL